MQTLYIVLGVLGGVLLLLILPFVFGSLRIYHVLLVRTNKSKWSRECSLDDDEQREMFRMGLEWGAENEAYHKQVTVTSEGFKLVGEYFDFGNKKAVIIVPGRMETCAYSYYFAKPYKEMGYNILAIDNRSHGLSEGRYNTVGLREYKDVIAWAKLLKEQHGVESVILHGICIGGATSTCAAAVDEGKPYFDGIITEGMYNHFGIMLKDRFIARKKPVFPFVPIILSYIQTVGRKNIKKFSPIGLIDKVEVPVLFIYSTKDIFSKPEVVQQLYDKCKTDKRIYWFDKGEHSHIRINNESEYDGQIKQFITDYLDK